MGTRVLLLVKETVATGGALSPFEQAESGETAAAAPSTSTAERKALFTT